MLGTSSVLAQPTPAQIEASKKAAAEAANVAFDAFTNEKFEEAIAGFQKAEAAFHAPKFGLYVARAQVKLGRLVAAKGTYEGILKEQLTSYAPPEFFTAQADAKKELAELAPRIPTLEVRIAGAITSVKVDGKPAVAGQAISVDPGEHTISGAGEGGAGVTRTVVLKEKETRVETLALDRASAAPPGGTAPEGGAPAPGSGSSPGVPTGTFVAYGVGAAGLILGGVFGGLTLAKKGDHDALTAGGSVDAKAANQVASEGKTFAIVSDVGFLVGIVGAATGTILWAVSPGKPAPGKPASATGGTFVGVYPGGVTLRRTF